MDQLEVILLTIWKNIRGTAVFLFLLIHTFLHAMPLYFSCLFRLIFPHRLFIQFIFPINTRIIASWVRVNNWMIRHLFKTQIHVIHEDPLYSDKWYVLSANHQNWFDVFAIFFAVQDKIPFAKYFVKHSIHYYPFLQLSIWALDCPAMKRYSQEQMQANPALRKKDLETANKACETMTHRPTCMMNFTEGTRFSQKKHAKQHSPYQHLLKPKAGGIAFVLNALGDKLAGVLDITIAYPNHRVNFWHFLRGDIREVTIHTKLIPIPQSLIKGDYQNDEAYRGKFKQWLDGIWKEKDQRVATMMQALSFSAAKDPNVNDAH